MIAARRSCASLSSEERAHFCSNFSNHRVRASRRERRNGGRTARKCIGNRDGGCARLRIGDLNDNVHRSSPIDRQACRNDRRSRFPSLLCAPADLSTCSRIICCSLTPQLSPDDHDGYDDDDGCPFAPEGFRHQPRWRLSSLLIAAIIRIDTRNDGDRRRVVLS